jgi:hypothetical protein
MRFGALLLLIGCTRFPSVARHAITNGMLDDGDPAVAALLLRVASCGAPPVVFCSATAIAPRALLTAAHCLDVAPLGAAVAFFGSDATAGGEFHSIVAGFRHPSLDLAVLALDRSTTSTISIGPPPSPGSSVRLVGFGADEKSLIGPKRQGTALVDSADSMTVVVKPSPALACGGDSGGPLLYMEQLAGVTSYGDANCSASATYSVIDPSFVADAVRQIAALPESPRPSPTALCHFACGSDADCPSGFQCSAARCTLPGAAVSDIGERCTAKSSCSCAALEGGCFCLHPCPEPGGCSFAR